ncbi:MAG: hypothetical protein GY749_24390 [Desulfobacteraceae bacterium]|nr:hypothetical protein [Desulfobacteraceae bacterium]
MKVMALRYLKTLFILLFAVFFSWQTALAQDPLTFEGEPAELVFQDGTYKFIPEVKGGDENYTFDYLGKPDWMEIEVVNGENGSVILKNKDGRPTNDDVGIVPETPIKIWVTDGTGTQVFLPDFKVTVQNINDNPDINEVQDPVIKSLNQLQILGEDTVERGVLYDLDVTDIDLKLGDRLYPPEKLTFHSTGIPNWLEYVDDDGDGIPELLNKEGRPDNGDVREIPYEIQLIVADSRGGSDSVDIQINITNANDPPSVAFDPLPESEVNQDAEWSATFKGADVDFDHDENEALKFSVDIYKLEGEDYLLKQTLTDDATEPAEFWLSSIEKPDTDSTVRTLSGTPKDDDVGKYKIILKVTDAANLQSVSATIEEAFMLEVVNVNDPPTITIEGEYETTLGQASIDNGSVAPGLAFSIKPTVGDVDEEDVLTLTAPDLSEIAGWLEFVDTDDDQVPDTLRNKENRPNNEDAGATSTEKTYSQIKLCVDDNTENSTLVCMTLPDIIVENKNDIPVVKVEEEPPSVVSQAYFGKKTVNPGASFNFKPDINDPDGDPLTVTVEGDIPDWLEFVDTDNDQVPDTLRNKENRPNNDDPELAAGSLRICATDGTQEVCTVNTYTIKAEDVNDPPTLTTEKPPSNVDQSYGTCCVDPEDTDSLLPVAQGDIINFAVQLADIDDDFANLKCFMDNKPAWLELITVQDPETSETNYFMVNSENRPANSDVGTYTGIKICASDEKADPVCTEEFTITVDNVNDPPTISGSPHNFVPQVIEDTAEGESYTYPEEYDVFEIKDPDLELENTQEKLYYYFVNKPGWMTNEADDDGNLTAILNEENRPNQGDVGVHEKFQICVKDSDGASACTDPVDITVGNENDPPTITPATDNDPVTKIDYEGKYSSSFLINDVDENTVLNALPDLETFPPWLTLTISEDKTTVTLEGSPKDSQDIADIYENVTIVVSDGNRITRYSFNIQVVTPTPGDINYDGSIDITDAVLALQILAGLTPDNVADVNSDVNGDGKIGVQDVLYILRMIVLQPSNISAALAKNLIDTTSDLVIIDVSTMYDQGHLPLARNYPVNDGILADEIPNLDKNGQYLVYCHSDSVSLKAAQMLLAEGFQTVYRLEGNYDAWEDAGYLIDISAATAKELIDSSTDEELIVIDVASSDEYAGGHIPGASTYPLSEDALDNVIPNLSKEKKYLVYCRSDESSVIGGNKLVEAGFKPVYRLSGNFDAWKAAGYEIEPKPEP